MPNFAPVCTQADIDTLDEAEMMQGFLDGYSEDPGPEPGANRGRSYWHGWRVAGMDRGRIEIDACHRRLCHELHPGGRAR